MKNLAAILIGLLLICSIGSAQATPIVMAGKYIYTQVSDNGTLGNEFAYPGIQYDPVGEGNFPGEGGKDFLQPGIPFEGFYVKSDQTDLVGNNNYYSRTDISGSLIDLSSSSPYVRWTGNYGEFFNITIDTYFNQTDRRINFTTTIEALTDLTNLKFLRVIDPDQDVNDYGTFETNNYRGYGDTLSPESYVYAVGPYSNWTIGLFSNSSLSHNTGVSACWSTDPDSYLSGNNDGNGDYTIGIAFDLGNLNEGQSVTFRYAYVLGESPSVAASAVPIPGSVFLLGSGLLSLIGVRINRKKC